MPREAAELEEALNKNGGLTLSRLANYDDLITDALVDRVYYWSTIRKLKPNYHACRGVQEEDVCKILQRDVVCNKDAVTAHKKMLELPGLKKFYRSLATEDEQEHFQRHLRKYINIYLPDCPFEVCTTNRYTIVTAEACIRARKHIRKGEPIKYLIGIQVEMTEREEKELSSRTDFSIVLSSRRKRPSLFLGPARFANHDCDANARLNTSGPHGIHIAACKEIAPGDEITVTYGENYFGVDNCECLCETCETLQRNGWDPTGPPLREESSDEEEENANDFKATKPAKTSLGKRKRALQPMLEEGQPRKRGPGRPRKYPRIEDPTSRNGTVGDKIVIGNALESRFGNHEMFFPSGHKTPGNPVLDKIYSLLVNVADRRRREYAGQRDMSMHSYIAYDDEVASRSCSVYRNGLVRIKGSPDSSEMGGITSDLSIIPPLQEAPPDDTSPVRDMSSCTPSTESVLIKRQLEEEIRDSTFPTPDINRLSEESEDVVRGTISKAPTPPPPVPEAPPEAPLEAPPKAPLEAPPKRKRGRPRKNPLPEIVVESASTASSSTTNTDSASQISHASSATSFETFAAGSIAQSICEMLEADRNAEVLGNTDAQAQDPIDPNSDHGQTRRQSQWTRSTKQIDTATAGQELSTNPVDSIEQSGVTDPDASPNPLSKNRGPVRTPGDYQIGRTLLASADHRWVECRNCDELFVQNDARQTRIACPRCERHSKLYGYYWPKTDKDGKGDTEERVLDHRTVHRFIGSADERHERKGRKSALLKALREQQMFSPQRSEESERSASGKRLRNIPRRSEGGRKTRKTM